MTLHAKWRPVQFAAPGICSCRVVQASNTIGSLEPGCTLVGERPVNPETNSSSLSVAACQAATSKEYPKPQGDRSAGPDNVASCGERTTIPPNSAWFGCPITTEGCYRVTSAPPGRDTKTVQYCPTVVHILADSRGLQRHCLVI
jgi:hypothetical protein